jgi:hypothetical protein
MAGRTVAQLEGLGGRGSKSAPAAAGRCGAGLQVDPPTCVPWTRHDPARRRIGTQAKPARDNSGLPHHALLRSLSGEGALACVQQEAGPDSSTQAGFALDRSRQPRGLGCSSTGFASRLGAVRHASAIPMAPPRHCHPIHCANSTRWVAEPLGRRELLMSRNGCTHAGFPAPTHHPLGSSALYGRAVAAIANTRAYRVRRKLTV